MDQRALHRQSRMSLHDYQKHHEHVRKQAVLSSDFGSQKDEPYVVDDDIPTVKQMSGNHFFRKKKSQKSPERVIYPPGSSEQDAQELIYVPRSSNVSKGRNDRLWSAMIPGSRKSWEKRKSEAVTTLNSTFNLHQKRFSGGVRRQSGVSAYDRVISYDTSQLLNDITPANNENINSNSLLAKINSHSANPMRPMTAKH